MWGCQPRLDAKIPAILRKASVLYSSTFFFCKHIQVLALVNESVVEQSLWHVINCGSRKPQQNWGFNCRALCNTTIGETCLWSLCCARMKAQSSISSLPHTGFGPGANPNWMLAEEQFREFWIFIRVPLAKKYVRCSDKFMWASASAILL